MVTLNGSYSAKEFALREMASRIDELPLLPQSLAKILQLNSDDNEYFTKLEHCTKAEPAFAVRMVAKANSARLSIAAPVLTLNSAMVRLGAANVRTLVSTLAVQRVFVPTQPDQIRLWVHSILVAVATQRVSELVPELEIDPGMAYLVGLLHDVGRFVMLEHASESLAKVNEKNWQTPDDLIRSDLDVFSYTHSELGYLACKRWHLPDQICQFVRYHHSPFKKKITPNSLEALVFCNQVADRLAINSLEDESTENLSATEMERLVGESCYRRPQDRDLLPANTLAKNIPQIKNDGAKILAELGF